MSAPARGRRLLGDPLPTTTIDTWYAVGALATTGNPLPGSGGAGGWGCSPGSSALPDGVWFVFIEGAADDHITFDLACTWPGRSMDEGCITNDSDRLRTIDVDWRSARPGALWLTRLPAGMAVVNDGVATELQHEFLP